jgi:ketosteroid isomerase-like protein
MTKSAFSRAMFVVLLLAQGCRPSNSADDLGGEKEVRQAMDRFLTALNTLDLVQIDSMFTDDVSAFVPSVQGTAVKGRAAMRQIFDGYAARFPDGPPPPTVPQDLVVFSSRGLGVVAFVVPDSARGVVRRRTFVFRRTPSGWRISHYHASDFAGTPAPSPS